MRRIAKKILTMFIMLVLLINSSLLVLISTALDEVERLIDESKIEANIEINLEKYVNYKITEESKGTIVQANIKSGIEYKEDQQYNPIKSTEISINSPKIEDEYPESVEVLTKATKATNGDEKGKHTYYEYNKNSGELKIIAENKENEEGKIYDQKVDGAKDEYEIIYYYSKNCYNDKNKERDLTITGKIYEKLANENETNIQKEFTQENKVTENIAGLISTQISTSDIYNGFINSNKQNNTQNDTEFTENIKIDVSYKNIADEILIEEKDKFKNKREQEINTENIVYRSTKIMKQNVLDKLGEDGKLQILNKNGDILGEINKDTETAENGSIEINYENDPTEILFKLSKPVQLGTIEINNKKTIKKEMTEIENNKIIINNTVKCMNNKQEKNEDTQEIIREYQEKVYEFENNADIEIKQSETKIDLAMDETEWTNSIQNEINLKLTLMTNDVKYNLYKNPQIEITLPNEVEKVILGNTSILYNNDLNLQSTELVEKNGRKVINIKLSGMQSQYTIDSAIEGTTILIPATVIIKKDIDSVDTKLEMTYTNETGLINDYTKEEKTNKETGIRINCVNDQQPETRNQSLMLAVQEPETNITEGIDIQVKAKLGNKELTDGDTVYEKQVIKYIVSAKNTTNKDITGINIQAQIPEGTTYATIDRGSYYNENYEYIKDETKKQFDFTINSLNAGETKEEFYEVVVNDLAESETQKNIVNTITTKINSKDYNSQTINNVIKKAKMNVELKSYIGRDAENSFYYAMYLYNLSDEDINNIYVETSEFQKEMKFNNLEYIGCETYNEEGYTDTNATNITDKKFENRKLKINLDKIATNSYIILRFNLVTDNFDEKINECEIKMCAIATIENEEAYISNENIRLAYPEYVTAVINSDTEGENLKHNDELNYTINIKNESKIRTYVKIQNYLPEDLDAINAVYNQFTIKNEEDAVVVTYDIKKEANLDCEEKQIEKDLTYKVKGEPNIDLLALIPANKTITIRIKTKVGIVAKEKEIENYCIVSGKNIDTTTSNIIKNTLLSEKIELPEGPTIPNNPIDPSKPINPTNPENPGNEGKSYNISGVVWIDSDNNGKRDEKEEKFKNVTVKLYDAEKNAIVVDSNNNKKITTTDENGLYTFSNIKNGKYLVLFEYDNSNYTLAKYKVSGVDDSLNSDATEKEVSIDGNIKIVGVTDKLIINETNLNNIDLGIVKKKKLDLSLKKYVSKITVQNGEGTKEYNYENEQLAKIEISAKQVENTRVNIQYKIVVTNEGNTDAYINEIIDYLPEGLEIEKKDEWTAKSNGNIINTTLAEKVIKQGESKEIILNVTKQMTSDSIGTISNSAEIGKIINLENLKDIDSIEGNKNTSEDDYSEAKVIISIKTGLIRNLSIIFIIIILSLIIAYCIKNKKIKILFCMSFLIILNISTIISFSFNVDPDIHILSGTGPGNYTFEDRNHKNIKWTCIDTGAAQCNPGNHYYAKADDTIQSEGKRDNSKDETKTNSISEVKLEKISTTVEVQDTGDGNYLVGPFCVNSNQTGDIDVYVDDQNKNDSVFINTNYDQNFNITANQCYCFYVKVSSSVYTSKNPIGKITARVNVTNTRTTTTPMIRPIIYYCTSVSGNHGGCSCQAGNSKGTGGCQRMSYWDEYEDDETEEITLQRNVSWGPIIIQPKNGYLYVQAVDADTGAQLKQPFVNYQGFYRTEGVKSSTDATPIFQAGSCLLTSACIEVPAGYYYISLNDCPSGYNFELQELNQKIQAVNVLAGQTSNVIMKLKLYRNLNITKVDSHIESKKLAGVEFRIYSNGNYLKEVTTDIDGIISIPWLPIYYNWVDEIGKAWYAPVRYEIKEVGFEKVELSDYYDISTTPTYVYLDEGFDRNSPDQSYVYNKYVTIKNEQTKVSIAGSVFEDKANNKDNAYDGFYNENENHISGIKVILKKPDGNIETTTTDATGIYRFKRLEIKKLDNYNVQFEYNGLKYENTIPQLNLEKNPDKNLGSKAIESKSTRENFNRKFSQIEGKSEKNENYNTTGKVLNNLNEKEYDLTYNGNQFKSELMSNMGYSENLKKGNYIDPYPFITSDIKSAGYSLKWTPGMKEIMYVDFGLKERVMPDMSLNTDIDNIVFEIGNYKETYNYNDGIKINGVKEYTSNIYKNYLYATAATGEGAINENLNIYATFKIKINNNSGGDLQMTANKVTNYYDDVYDLTSSTNIKSWVEGSTVTWTVNGNEMTTDSLKNIKIGSGMSKTIYLKLKLKQDTIGKWIENIDEEESTIRNTFEISSYSTYTSNGKIYAGIDSDSAPENATLGKISTYEDDTEAIVIRMKFKDSRSVTGTVFEDKTDEKLKSGNQRLGNGKLDGVDKKVSGVKVELLKEDKSVAYTYNGKIPKKAEVTVGADGKYEFKGVIPGKYYLRYTYGDGSTIENKNVTTQNYKSTIRTGVVKNNENTLTWYRNTGGYSVALDDTNQRTNINNKLNKINYETETKYQTKNNSMNDLQKISALSPKFEVTIENGLANETLNSINPASGYSGQEIYGNINFGIVERARQSISVKKKITHVKLQLANEQCIVDGNPSISTLKYVTYPTGGDLKIELDPELMQGAQLDVEYTIEIKNNSELDYNTTNYANYGIVTANDLVKTSITSLADYMDENLNTTYTGDGGEWKIAKAKSSGEGDFIKDKQISSDVYSKVKNYNNILLTQNNDNLKKIAPGEAKTIKVTAKKLLSNEEDATFDNNVELIQVENPVGRFYGWMQTTTQWKLATPGNYTFENETSECDNDDETLIVMPSTGQNRIYYILGITCLLTLVGGIYLIKKKVL